MVKHSESIKTLLSVAEDLFDLIGQFKGYCEVPAVHSFKLFERVFKEHCDLNVLADNKVVELKKPQNIPSNCLQNSSYLYTIYSGCESRGYIKEKLQALGIEISRELLSHVVERIRAKVSIRKRALTDEEILEVAEKVKASTGRVGS